METLIFLVRLQHLYFFLSKNKKNEGKIFYDIWASWQSLRYFLYCISLIVYDPLLPIFWSQQQLEKNKISLSYPNFFLFIYTNYFFFFKKSCIIMNLFLKLSQRAKKKFFFYFLFRNFFRLLLKEKWKIKHLLHTSRIKLYNALIFDNP